MAVITAYVYADNFRDVDGCDSTAAVDAIVQAIIAEAEALDDHDITVTTRSGQGHPTIQVVAANDDDDLEDTIRDRLNSASDRAISDGDWEDEA